MGEHRTTFRILGTSAAEVLQRVVGQLPSSARVRLDGSGLSVDDRWCISDLETRNDGVVVLVAHDTASVGALPEGWLVCQESSFSRGIDYEALEIVRGGDILLSLLETPEGHLEAREGDRLVEEIRRRWTSDGERVPTEGDEITWEVFRDRHLARVASSLGDGAAVLSAVDTASTHDLSSSGGDGSPEDDVMPFCGDGSEEDDGIPF